MYADQGVDGLTIFPSDSFGLLTFMLSIRQLHQGSHVLALGRGQSACDKIEASGLIVSYGVRLVAEFGNRCVAFHTLSGSPDFGWIDLSIPDSSEPGRATQHQA